MHEQMYGLTQNAMVLSYDVVTMMLSCCRKPQLLTLCWWARNSVNFSGA